MILLAAWTCGATGCATASRQPAEPMPGEPTLRVMTYNVNYGLAGDRPTLDAIRAGDADLVLLQETTPDWELVLRTTLAADYPHMAFRQSDGAGGMAILSRAPFLEREWVPSPSGWFPGWRILATTRLGPVQVLTTACRRCQN